MKKYDAPWLSVLRLNATAVLTASTEDEWDDAWDDALDEEEQQDDA